MKRILFVVTFLLILVGCENSKDKEIEAAKMQLEKVAGKINSDFINIRQKAAYLADEIKKLYENQDELAKKEDKSKYKLAANGVFHKHLNDGGAAVYVSGNPKVNSKIKNIVYFTAPIDATLKTICEQYKEIAQVYYNDKNSYNRIYPFIDVLSQYEPKLHIPDFNFYYLADKKHNPEKKALWVNDPYVDPAGRGWMVSAIAPVYYNGELVGVPGIDVTINTIIERYLSDQNSDLIIIDEKGVLVAAEESSVTRLYFPPLKTHKYIETVKSEKYRKDDYNLLKSKNTHVRRMAEKILKQNIMQTEFSFDGEDYLVLSFPLEEINWKLLKIIKL